MNAVTLRIAYLSGSIIPSRQANSVHVMKMCQALAKAGHDVVLGAIAGAEPDGDDFTTYGVDPCFRIVKHATRGGGLAARLGYALAIPRKLRGVIRPDLVYGRHLLSLSVAARWGAPVVFEAHQAPTQLERAVERRLFARGNFARLVVISGALRDEYRRLHPKLAGQRILVAHDAADVPPADALHGASTGGAGRLQVGYVGHLYPGKGMEIMAPLAARLPGVDFHVVGGTDQEIAAWRQRTAGSENLHYHGHVPPADTEAHRAAMDILLVPCQATVLTAAGAGAAEISRWMSPLKVFESMASRRPMIASDLPVLREVLRHGETALLAPPDDLEAWVAAIERLRDPALRRRLADRAAARFVACHTWAHRAESVLADLPGLAAAAALREAAA